MNRPRPHVVIAGGGVAALEAMLALRALAGSLPSITLIAPERVFSPPAVSVAMPFGFGPPPELPLGPLAARFGVELVRGRLGEIDTGMRTVAATTADPIRYDHLVVAVGAPRRAAVPGALTFRGPADAAGVEAILDDVVEGRARGLAVAVPSAGTWSLPAYEIAIMAAIELRSRGVRDPEIALVTPEEHPLEVFGEAAGQAVDLMLAERGIALHAGVSPVAAADGVLRLRDGGAVPADLVIALPEVMGPHVAGLPASSLGFITTDAHARVTGLEDVYAAGDATAFPLRQGGLAAQQADAAAESIAQKMGAIAEAQPFRPVLRGVLLTGGAPLYLRTVVGSAEAPVAKRLGSTPGTVARTALWWPPAKVAGRYLAPLTATARPVALHSSPMEDRGLVAAPPDRESADALALTLLMADEDARCGDHRQALHALEAARALAGGVLPRAYAAKELDWSARA